MAEHELPDFGDAAGKLVEIGGRFYGRDWVLGTSGNFSAVVSRRPLRLAITASAVHKGRLTPREILEIDGRARVTTRGANARPAGRSSAETRLHLEIVRLRGAGAVLHTHSVWSTILSETYASGGGLVIDGYEMLKGLEGVTSHDHREWIPIVNNDQDMTRLSGVVRKTLRRYPRAHALLLRRHGLYTWGHTIAEAERHVEILEFLLETIGRTTTPASRKPEARGQKLKARS